MITFANPARPPRAHKAARPLRLAAVAAAVSLATAGCTGSGGNQPSTTPPATTTTTSTTTTAATGATTTSSPTTTSAPTSTTKAIPPAVAGIPPAARANTDAGAEAFAKYFWTQLGQLVSNVEPAEIIGLYGPDCSLCQEFVDDFTRSKAKGEAVRGGRAIVSKVDVLGGDSPETQVIVTYTQSDFARYDKHGKLIETTKGSTGSRAGLKLAFRAGHWIVLEAGGAG